MTLVSKQEMASASVSGHGMIRNQVGFRVVPKRPTTDSSSATSGGPMNAMQRLIRTRMAELDLSFAEVGRRGGIPPNTVWALAKKSRHRQPPRAQTLERLARGLDLPLDVVRAAAADAAGYRLEEVSTTLEAAEDVRIVVAAMAELSAADRAKLRRMAQMFADEMRDEDDRGKKRKT